MDVFELPTSVAAGQPIDLGKLEWKPVRYRRQIWDIGVANRNGSDFFKGDDYFHWGDGIWNTRSYSPTM
jgi:hypothetical protein